jgi:aminoglycoside 6'-N-acetyltransferase I
MQIETISPNNLDPLATLMCALWPDCSFDEILEDCRNILGAENEICFLAKEEDHYIGFIQLTMRTDYVEGADELPIAYIEGMYVQPAFQQKGIGKKLIALAEEWSLQKGCQQLASDAELSNTGSLAFHHKAGFVEANRVVCFIKNISAGGDTHQ